jgi:rhamnogalacturonyl hydrolase YesR
MALVDTLDYFPEKHPGRARLLKYLESLTDAVVAAQDQTYKGWYNIMDPGMEARSGNYIESSGSAMFVYALFKSLRLGYISGPQYDAAALSGYDLMTSTFLNKNSHDGSLAWEWTAQTGSLSSNGTFEVSISTSINYSFG